MLVLNAVHSCTVSYAAENSQLKSVWYDRNFERAPLKKILVIGLSEQIEKQKAFENAFASVIRKGGGEAATGWEVLPPKMGVGKESVKAAIKGKGFDAVLVSRLLRVDLKTDYVSGTKTERPSTPSNPYNGSFDNDYQDMYNTVYTPGYLLNSRVVIMQTKIFSPEGELIWSAESETFDPHSVTDLVASLARAMGRDLSDKGLIAPRH